MTTTAVRLAWVDRLRGLAIVVMVIDHTLSQVDPDSLFRYTASRALGLPLFMLTSATVFAGPPKRRRRVQLLAAVAAEAFLFTVLDMRTPGILFVYALLLLGGVLDRASGLPWVFATAGVVQFMWWPLPMFDAYQPGEVLLWWCLGFMATGHGALIRWAHRLPEWVGAIGRRPLAWYVGHLIVIAIAVQFA